MAGITSKQRDLLLEAQASDDFVGFDQVESVDSISWRWALGLEQRIVFFSDAPVLRIEYEIKVPKAGNLIQFVHGEKLCLSLQSIAPDQFFCGFFEIENSHLGEDGRVLLNISSAFSEQMGGDQRSLAFSLFAFRIYPQERLRNTIKEFAGSLTEENLPRFFCVYPFSQVFVNEKGSASYPCVSSGPEVKKTIRSENDPSAPHNEAEIADAWNGPILRDTRVKMLAGDRPGICETCIKLEDPGAKSVRELINRLELTRAVEIARTTDIQGRVSGSPAMLDIRLGNLCNLKCRMCTPVYSVNLIEEMSEIAGRDFSSLRNNNWFKQPGVFEALLDSIEELEVLHIAGGEPFLIPECLRLLQLLVDRKVSQNVKLIFSTNLTNLNPKMLAMFPHFKEVILVVSVDGYGTTNDYIRYPSKFERLAENLRTLHENMSEFGVSSVRFNTTVQAYNVFDLPNLLRFLRSSFPKFEWCPNFSILQTPAYFSVLVLPREVRMRVVETLRTFLDEEVSQWPEIWHKDSLVREAGIRSAVESVMSYLDGEDQGFLLPEFQRVTSIYNKSRGQVSHPGEPFWQVALT